MTMTKESLGAARAIWDITDPQRNDEMLAAVFAAARFVERLLPGTCNFCDGEGVDQFGVGSGIIEGGVHSAAGEESKCPTCHGTGQLWDEGLVEVVARAIFAVVYPKLTWEEAKPETRDFYKQEARAVLAALVAEVGK